MAQDVFNKISARIIKEQALIIGPIAWEEAKKVPGINVVSAQSGEVTLVGDAKAILNKLVSQYTRLFGRASSDVCKDAVRDLIVELQSDQVPESLQ